MKANAAFVAVLLLTQISVSGLSTMPVFAAPAASPAAGSGADSEQIKSCRKFVQEFYTSYRKGCQGVHKVDPLNATLKAKKASFSPVLLQKLNDDQDFASKFPGEIVGLDFDPFFNGQDMAETYSVDKVIAANAGKYHADVYGTWDGKKSAKPDVVPELEYKDGHWIFVNFLYPESKEPENRNLISLLDAIKKARPPLPTAAKKETKKK